MTIADGGPRYEPEPDDMPDTMTGREQDPDEAYDEERQRELDQSWYDLKEIEAEQLEKTMINCSICGLKIKANEIGWDQGNNAAPVNNGRCCDRCNATVVIPRRLNDLNKDKKDVN